MVAALETAIRCECLAADDAEDYLLHMYGGRLAEQAERARLSAYDFAYMLYEYAAGSEARASALQHEREAAALAAANQPSKGLERQCAERRLDIAGA